MARSNPRSGARDMIISLSVILVPVLILVFLFASPGDADKPTGNGAVSKAEISRVLDLAREQSSYPLLVPEGLGDDWTPMRVGWAKDGETWITGRPADGDSWQVGYLGPDDIYYGVQQRNRSTSEFIAATTRDGRPLGGDIEAAGRTWQRYESKDSRTNSLVSEDADSAAVVSADTDFMTLEAFAGTLSEVAPVAG